MLLGGALIAWAGFSVAAYFVAHKPIALEVIGALTHTVWSLSVSLLLAVNAFSLGVFTLKKIAPSSLAAPEGILIAGGIGLGELGILGFGFAATGLSDFFVLFLVQLAILFVFLWQRFVNDSLLRIKVILSDLLDSARQAPAWMKIVWIAALLTTAARTFLPPIEAFDALLYHLRTPDLWIQDGGLQAYNIPHYWFPNLVEGVYFWGLGLKTEIVAQQMHFLWAILVSLLIWAWTHKLFSASAAWWALTIIASMPSFLLLASWAYTDMALCFYGVAMLYCLWAGIVKQDEGFWKVSAISAGMAMGVKYTSFVMPLSAVAIIALWGPQTSTRRFASIIRFGVISALTGGIWYIRNWVWMGNPFYPFVFGGKYWDAVRAATYSGAGTGSGWDIGALLLLPLTITLGNNDVNYFDGNIGPLFLLALPLVGALYVNFKTYELPQKAALSALGLFILLSAGAWLLGYVSTRNLWQTRLLFPALLPLVIPAAVGFTFAARVDRSKLKASFIVVTLAALAICANILDFTLGTIARNPLGIAIGSVSAENFSERYQPGYFHALQLISKTPTDSRLYALFEPRSYGSVRTIQPDPILDNFSHDLYLYKTPAAVVESWRAQGYTHILLNVRGAEFILGQTDDKTTLKKTLGLLSLVTSSPAGDYALYEIP